MENFDRKKLNSIIFKSSLDNLYNEINKYIEKNILNGEKNPNISLNICSIFDYLCGYDFRSNDENLERIYVVFKYLFNNNKYSKISRFYTAVLENFSKFKVYFKIYNYDTSFLSDEQDVEKKPIIVKNNNLSKNIVSKVQNTSLNDNKIKKIITNSIIPHSDITLQRLSNILKNNGYSLSNSDIVKFCREIQEYLCIEMKMNYDDNKCYESYSLNKKYSYKYQIPYIFNLKPNSKIKILFISDRHIHPASSLDYIKHSESIIQEYCAKNNINYIIDLGDIFNKNTTINEAIKISDYILNANNDNDQSIPILILGGNHDYTQLSYGFDPLEYLNANSNNIVNMGYLLNNLVFGSDKYYLLHPITSAYNYVADKNDYNAIINAINESLNRITESRNMHLDNFKLGIASGHYHQRFISPENGIISVGSIPSEYVQAEFIVNNDGNISNIIYIPTKIINNVLSNTNCPIYQKIIRN